MHIVLLEPLAVPEEKIKSLAGKLEAMGHEFTYYNTRTEDKGELTKRASHADIVILANLPFPGAVINACPNLKMISVAFTGVDHIDMNACRERGIIVCNAAGYSTHSVAELAFGLMISVLRKIVPCDTATRNSKTKDGLIGNELYGKTLGIVGTGAIGMRVAEIGRAFGCRLLAYSRTQKEEAKALGVEYTSLENLLAQSDIVSLHTPLTGNTRLLLGKERIALMKPAAILINTARGPVVDNAALAEALKTGKLAGAGIDVYETEPPLSADHPLLNAPNVVALPHVGFATREAFARRAEIVFENIYLWLQGRPQYVM